MKTVTVNKRKLKDGRMSLFLKYYDGDPNNQQTESLGLYYDPKNTQEKNNALRLAEDIRSKKEIDFRHNQHGWIAPSVKRENFLNYFQKIAQGKSNKSHWDSAYNHLKAMVGGDYLAFESVTKEWLKQTVYPYFYTQIKSEALKASSCGIYYEKIKHALKQSVIEDKLPVDPASKVDRPKFKEQEPKSADDITQRDFEYLTAEEIELLIKSSSKYGDVRRAFLFATQTGIRLGDIENLLWENVKNGDLDYHQGKTATHVIVPLSEFALSLLTEQREAWKRENVIPMDSQNVFDLPTRPTINGDLKDWANAAGITKHVTFHVSRHTAATLLLRAGAALSTVRDILGHSDIKQTQRYAKVLPQSKADAVNSLPRFEVG